MIEKVTNSPVNNLFSSPLYRNNSGIGGIQNQVSSDTQIENATLIKMAMMSAVQSDKNAVETARRLIQSGELDTQENILLAAEQMLKFGI